MFQLTHKYDTVPQNPEINRASPLHVDAFLGKTDKLALDFVVNPSLMQQNDKIGYTPAHYAAQEGHLSTFKFIIKSVPNLLTNTALSGSTPAHIAAMAGHIDILKLILAQKKTLANKANILKKTPFHISVENGKMNVISYLLENYSEYIKNNEKLQKKLVLIAVKSGHLQILKYLIDYRNDLSKGYKLDILEIHNLVFEAVSFGHFDVLQYFIKSYPNAIELRNSDGATLVHIAAQKGAIEILKYLSSINPKLLTSSDYEENTPTHYASGVQGVGECEDDNLGTLEYMLQNIPEQFSVKNVQGHTPIEMLGRNNWYKSIACALKYFPKLTMEQIYLKEDFSYSMECPNCIKNIEYKRYSSFANTAPHFYCTDCSNVYILSSYNFKICDIQNEKEALETLKEIEQILPACECGGHFKPDASPKCPHCKFDLKNEDNSLERLHSPFAIVIRGCKEYFG